MDSAFVFPGITLATWNSIPHTQDTFQSGLAGDLGISASQVTIGDFKQQTNPNGLYVPFTVSGLGGTNAQALNVRPRRPACPLPSWEGVSVRLVVSAGPGPTLAPATTLSIRWRKIFTTTSRARPAGSRRPCPRSGFTRSPSSSPRTRGLRHGAPEWGVQHGPARCCALGCSLVGFEALIAAWDVSQGHLPLRRRHHQHHSDPAQHYRH